ncbi:phosphopantothenoylcysteine decarboxylase isoform X5 [Heptranchias perlo]|uniref:phosphopantothenoylcysteine decarboxylase isoform X5 n=1 Tax=Heptranchias perlo TaxID=212740 RepID=UPI003559CE47
MEPGPARRRVLLAVSGSVAALRLPQLVAQLLASGEMWKQRTDPVLHIDLRRWAALMLIAPLDANTLGKIASGICDNLLTCVVRAWDRKRPLLFCPAMNTAMWEHPITATQIQTLKSFGYIEVPCIVKKLVCGDEVGSPGNSMLMFFTIYTCNPFPECDRITSANVPNAEQ